MFDSILFMFDVVVCLFDSIVCMFLILCFVFLILLFVCLIHWQCTFVIVAWELHTGTLYYRMLLYV